ncbi:MAG: hypothetical protein ACXU8O_03505, partial [Asticcacaulis sp.]
MRVQDTFDAPPPSDFAAAPIHHYYFFETGILIVLIIAGIWILSAIYGNANFRAARQPQDAVKKRVDRVVKAMAEAARANQTNQVKLAEEVKAAVDKQFSATLKLSEALNKAIGPLNKALEGTREEDAPIRALTGPSTVTGGTVINIAVSGNESVAAGPVAAMAAPSVAPAPNGTPAEPEAMSPDERSAALWTAVQRLFNAWKNKTAIIAAFHSAQAQLTASPLWE